MIIVVGIRFREVGKVYYFDPGDLELSSGTHVIVETVRGVECGEVIIENKNVKENEIVSPLKKVIRVATEKDIEKYNENKEKEKDAFRVCEEKIIKHKLTMNLVEVEYTFDNNKILFYFTADGRVDFRDLVKDLAAVFKTRIELRQIGVRDEAKMMGGLGMCGRELCCSTHLSEFHPVSIKMAKEQGLSLNPTKISGSCGRLMCCLKYEQEAYEDVLKRMPGLDSLVKTPMGKGHVSSVCLLKEKVKVILDKDEAKEVMEFKLSELKVLKNTKKIVRNVNVEKNNDGDENMKDIKD